MNYKAELRGFALDRAIRTAEINKSVLGHTSDLADIIKQADEIVEYLYIPEKDIKGMLETVVPMIAQSGDLERIADLILQLQQLEAEMQAGLKGSEPVVSAPEAPEIVPVEAVEAVVTPEVVA